MAEAINNNNCQQGTINPSENNISDMGAQRLAEAIDNINCQLGTLDLSLNNISAQHLAEAMKDNNCQQCTLNLSVNQNIRKAGKLKAHNLPSNGQSKFKLIN